MAQTGDAQKSWCQRLHSAGPLQEQDPDIVCLICAGHLHCGTEAVDPGDGKHRSLVEAARKTW